MYLQEVFDQLVSAELSDSSITAAGKINPESYDRIVAQVNLALGVLFKRFRIKEGELSLELQQGQLQYPLASKYAVSSQTSREAVRYIKDSLASPFKDDVIKIERVYGESGVEFGMNDLGDPYSMRTPVFTTLVVPQSIVTPPLELDETLKTTTLRTVYRARHPLILPEGKSLDPEDVELELPYEYLDAMVYYMSARLLAPAGVYNGANPSNDYYAKYEAACMEIENKGLQTDNANSTDRNTRNGWV